MVNVVDDIVLVVDDDEFNRQGVRGYLEQKGYAVVEAGDEETAFALAQVHFIQLAVVDIVIPACPNGRGYKKQRFGLRLATRLKRCYPTMGVVLFSAFEDSGSVIFDLLREGMRGIAYKLKGCRPSELLAAMREVRSGRVFIDPEVTSYPSLTRKVLDHLPQDERLLVEAVIPRLQNLTAHEKNVAQLLTEAYSSKQIAEKLKRSPKSIENCIETLYQKLDLDGTVEGNHRQPRLILAIAYLIAQLGIKGKEDESC